MCDKFEFEFENVKHESTIYSLNYDLHFDFVGHINLSFKSQEIDQS